MDAQIRAMEAERGRVTGDRLKILALDKQINQLRQEFMAKQESQFFEAMKLELKLEGKLKSLTKINIVTVKKRVLHRCGGNNMNKPTIFFSHSSKDKDMIMAIKNKIADYTGNVLDIFLSSDGQSIPFGTNWIHKIEEGLDNAQIMFVFVTENSLSTGWIYFEAGFAYSKKIQVIPVGIGITVGSLKAPLNLLQGFNITSADSLNNFISIINQKFSYSFSEKFTPNDYSEIMRLSTFSASPAVPFDDIVLSVESTLLDQYNMADGTKIEYNLVSYFERILNYFNENSISYSVSLFNYPTKGKEVSVGGIRIQYSEPCERGIEKRREPGGIKFTISPYNFKNSFSLLTRLNQLLPDKEYFYVYVRLKKEYKYRIAVEDYSALLSTAGDFFSCDKDHFGCFECAEMNVRFSIFNTSESNTSPDHVLSVVYKPNEIQTNSITELIAKLYEFRIIYKKHGGNADA